jgi:hypothetical protein
LCYLKCLHDLLATVVHFNIVSMLYTLEKNKLLILGYLADTLAFSNKGTNIALLSSMREC